MVGGYAPSINCFKLFLKEFRLIVDFRLVLLEFQIVGRKKEGKFSRNLFLARLVLKLWVLLGLLRGVKKSWKDSGSLLLMYLCMNIEELYWNISLNFNIPNVEKIGSVWELNPLPATLRTHFFCNFVIFSSLGSFRAF